jgi:hypothetical protein
MADGDRFDPVEFAATLRRLQDQQGYGDTPIRPAFDPQQYQEARADAAHGRRIQDYVVALERFGFTFYPANSIPPGCEFPIPEGQWRRPADRRLPKRMAMTDHDVVSWFPEGPEQLWNWLQGMAAQEHRQPLPQSRRIFAQCPGIVGSRS